MIPSGYKDQKVYSVKPLDGSGDLTFSRASNATRVGPDGLIEKVRTNLLLQSNSFDTTWANTDSAETSGQSDPNSGTTAWKITETVTATGATSRISQSIATSAGTLSFYAKAGEITQLLVFFGGTIDGVYFNLSTGAFINYYNTGSVFSGLSSVSVGGGWYRYSIVLNTSITSVDFYSAAANNFIHNTVSSNGYFLWRTQYEAGDIATDYIATTSAAVSVGPVSGLPRLDYLNSSCPRLLLEPQRTNVAQYSEQFNNAWWEKVGGSFTANALTSPDGYTDADTFTENTSTSTHYFYNASGFTGTAAAYTGSVFAKAGTRSRLIMGIYDGTAVNYQMVQFDLSAGTILQEASAGIAKIENYGNGWYRCSVTRTLTASTCYLSFGPHTNTNLSNLTVFPSYLGASGTLHFYGGQLEVGAYATSYIPTLGTSVTRVADAASKTGISSLIGQTEGTIFFELPPIVFSPTLSTYVLIELDGNIGAGYVHLYKESGQKEARLSVRNGATLQCDIAFSLVDNTPYKIAGVYKNNRFELYVNGVLRGSDYSGTLAAITMNKIQVAGDSFNANSQIATSQVLLFKTALTQAQCEQLTA